MTPAEIQALIDACRTGPSDLVMWAELKAVLEGLKNQDGVTSFNGRDGIVVGEEGDYNLTDMGDVVISVPTTNQILRYDGSDWVNDDETVYVPYTGATGNVTLGEYGLKAGWFGYDLTPTGTPTDQGTMYWDDARLTVALIMNGTTQHIGQSQYFYVKNSTGSSIAKGTAVGFAGTDGGSGHLLIEPFLADGSDPSSYFMGVTSEAIANGAFGQVMTFGELRGIDTDAFNDGDILYVSTTVAGGYQTTVPVAPNNIIQVAAVINAANNGTIVVRPTLGSKLTQDEAVAISSPTNGQVLQYNSSLGVWQNATISTDNIYTADGSLTANRTVDINTRNLIFSGSGQVRVSSTNSLGFRNLSTGATLAAATINGIAIASVLNNAQTGSLSLRQLDGTQNVYGITGISDIRASGTTGLSVTFPTTYIIGDGTNQFFRIFSNGNIGINTTTDAGYKLDCNGTVRVSGNLTFTDSLISTSATGVRIVNTGNTTQPVIIGNSNTNNSNVNVLTTVVGTNNSLTASTTQGSIYGNANTISVATIAATVIGTNNTLQTASMLEGQFAIGRFNNVSHAASSIIGTYQSTTGTNQLIFGLDRSNYTDAQVGYNDIYFGTGPRGITRVSSTGRGTDVTINGSGAGNVTDAAGGFLRLAAGKSAGAGTPPDVIFATASATTSGTTLQTLTNRWWVKGETGQLANVSSPDASAIFQLDSTTRGFLPPRMTSTQRSNISSPAEGLIVYDTTAQKLYVYTTGWEEITSTLP